MKGKLNRLTKEVAEACKTHSARKNMSTEIEIPIVGETYVIEDENGSQSKATLEHIFKGVPYMQWGFANVSEAEKFGDEFKHIYAA